MTDLEQHYKDSAEYYSQLQKKTDLTVKLYGIDGEIYGLEKDIYELRCKREALMDLLHDME